MTNQYFSNKVNENKKIFCISVMLHNIYNLNCQNFEEFMPISSNWSVFLLLITRYPKDTCMESTTKNKKWVDNIITHYNNFGSIQRSSLLNEYIVYAIGTELLCIECVQSCIMVPMDCPSLSLFKCISVCLSQPTYLLVVTHPNPPKKISSKFVHFLEFSR